MPVRSGGVLARTAETKGGSESFSDDITDAKIAAVHADARLDVKFQENAKINLENF